jgi:hypothetical protein
MALQGQMPLNLPENNLLDGLFTSGLRFVSTYPGLATSSGRVATARYEMLHLTEEGHRLMPPVGGNRWDTLFLCVSAVRAADKISPIIFITYEAFVLVLRIRIRKDPYHFLGSGIRSRVSCIWIHKQLQ